MPAAERRNAQAGALPAAARAGWRARVAPVRVRPEVVGRDSLGRRLLVLADVAAAAAALYLFVGVLGNDALAVTAVAAIPVVALIAKIAGLYDRDDLLLRKTTLDEVPSLFVIATVSALVVWLLESVLVTGELGKGQVLGLWLGLFVGMTITRAIARSAFRRLLPPEPCLVVGDRESAARIRERLATSRDIAADVCAEMPLVPRREEDIKNGFSSWTLEKLKEVTNRFGIYRILLAPDKAEGDAMLNLVRLAKATDLKVTIVPQVLEVVGSEIEPDDIDGLTALAVRHSALSRSSAALKRAFDLVGASVALVLLAPVMAGIAVAIRLDSAGSVLFRQIRVGRNGEAFEMLKFRTMRATADAEKEELAAYNEAKDGLFKINNDPRVTRVGRILRRTSLDELPQLFNVLSGRMSLVGPRPLILEEDELILGWRRSRLDLKPGVTGPWQLLGPHRVSLDDMVKLDYIYVGRWSIWNDAKILLRTFLHAVGLRGS